MGVLLQGFTVDGMTERDVLFRIAWLHRGVLDHDDRLVCAACATQAARERRDEAHLVRAWAKANGLPVKDTGRVSPDLVRQYRRRAAAA